MKKIFIIFLFIIFSSSFSLAKNNEKITVEDIEYVFFKRYINNHLFKNNWWQNEIKLTIADIEQLKRHIKRQKYRGIAKCFYVSSTNINDVNRCVAKIIRTLLSRSEYAKKRRPGSIFYVLDAVTDILPGKFPKNVRKVFKFSNDYKPEPGMKCVKAQSALQPLATFCIKYTKSFNKKLEKFKKDPSNEKVLGSSVVKYIKNVKIEDSIYEKIGTNNFRAHGPFWEAPRRGSAATAELTALERGERSIMELVPKTKKVFTTNYSLLGDMLNASVADVKKNNISPDLKKRRSLLKKYSLILLDIKEKLDEDNYKSIDKDVSKLSKTYKDLNALTARRLSDDIATLEDLSKKYNLSRERIRQIEAKAFEKLQKTMLDAAKSNNLLPRN